MVHLKSTSSRVLMQMQRCEPSTTSQAVCLWGQRRPQDSVPSSSVYLSSLAGALIPSHGFKFHLPFSVFTPVFLLGSRLLTISTWIPLRLRSPSISNTDSRILSPHSSPPCLPGLNRLHFSPGCSSFHLQSSSTHLFLSHPASNPSEKKFWIHYWFGFPIWLCFLNYFWYCKHYHFQPSLLHLFAN